MNIEFDPSKPARELLGRGNEAREEGRFPDSLALTNAAMDKFVEEKDYAGFAESVAATFLTRKHQARSSGYKGYLLLGLAEMQASAEIVEGLNDPTALAIPYFNLAKAYEELEKYTEAVSWYQKAVDSISHHAPVSHNRPGVIADFKLHLTDAEFMSGNTAARDRYEQEIGDLINSGEKEISDYNYNVWLSGAYLRAAVMWQKDDPTKSREYFGKAKELIDSDKRLTLRKEQLEKMEKEFGS